MKLYCEKIEYVTEHYAVVTFKGIGCGVTFEISKNYDEVKHYIVGERFDFKYELTKQ